MARLDPQLKKLQLCEWRTFESSSCSDSNDGRERAGMTQAGVLCWKLNVFQTGDLVLPYCRSDCINCV